MNATQLLTLTRHAIVHSTPLLILGAPGLGKTAITEQAAAAEGYAVHTLYLSMIDPVELYGLPVPVGDAGQRRVERLLDDMFLSLIHCTVPTVLLLDELDKAPPSTQAVIGPLLLSRTIGRHRLPDHVSIVATANRRVDQAGSNGILSHLISRMMVVTLNVDAEAWCAWAVRSGLASEVISLIRHRPSLLHDFDAEKTLMGTAPYPCPRSWALCATLTTDRVPNDVAPIAYAGYIGDGASLEYLAHLRLCAELPDLDAAFEHPDDVVLPKTMGGLYALVSGLAALANTDDRCASLFMIAKKMIDAKKTEFAMLLLRDLLTRWPQSAMSTSWVQAASGPLGKLIREL